MKITGLETLRLAEFPNLAWVRVHTDEGVAGLGETSFAAEAVEAYLHEFVAPRVLGRDPEPKNGLFSKPPGPGLGAELLPDLWKRKDATIRVSRA